jgi:hypothetical protein
VANSGKGSLGACGNRWSFFIPLFYSFPCLNQIGLGILPYDAGILSLLEKKLKRSFANGSEVILEGQYKSKRLLQLQTIINSEELLFVY